MLISEDPKMRYFHERLRQHMADLDPPIKYHDLQFMAGIPSGTFSAWKKSPEEKYSRTPTDTELEKLASVKELGLDLEVLRSWRAIDEYGESTIMIASKQLEFENKLGKDRAHEILEEETQRRKSR